MKSGSFEQSVSLLLSRDEADLVISMLANRCQVLAMTVVQLFLTDPPQHDTWRKHESGILCLEKDNLRRSYFLRIYCIYRRKKIWEHEVYNDLEYSSPRPFLHTFEGEESMVAFNFANEEEARQLQEVLTEKLEAKKKRADRRSRQSTSSYHQRPQTQHPAPASSGDTHLSNGVIPTAKTKPQSTASGGRRKDKDSRRRLTKADIGLPQDFRHVSHVGWDPNKGFDVDNIDNPQLKQFFQKAGVSDSHLKDKDTRDFIYAFINSHGGFDAVKNDLVLPPTPQAQHTSVPPPVPARTIQSGGLSYQTRSAPPPPPPPSRSGPLPPPPLPSQPPAIVPSVPPPLQSSSGFSSVSSSYAVKQPVPPPPPPAPSSGAPPPPPFPPPLPSFSVPVPPAPPTPPAPPAPPPPPAPTSAPISSSTPRETSSAPDPRSALMESIRLGKQLKHVEVENKRPTVADSRGDLLDQIRQGIELKSVQPLPRPSQTSTVQNGLAGALARALAERSRVIHSDSSAGSDEDNEDEDEWED